MPQLSVAVTLYVTLLREHSPASAGKIRLDGQFRAGFSASVTVTVNTQLLLLPLASVAVLVTVVVPSGNVLPLGGLLTRFVTAQLSEVMSAKFTLRLHWPGSVVSVRFVGQISSGFSLSVTVTVNVQLLRLPLASVTVLVTVVVPTGKVLPLDGLLTRKVKLQLSAVPTVKFTLLRLQRPGSALNTKLLGQVIVGG
jgi:galactitol-specific phosphotransferase system IIC component